MPRAGWVKPQSSERLSDHVALGVLTRTFPPELVDAVVREAGREEHRHRLLPARLVVYYVLAMALFSEASYEEVMRDLVEGLAWASGWRQAWSLPSKSAIYQARARLGVEPLERLFSAACVPLASPETPGAWYRGWQLVAMDGTTLDVADTAGNAAAFGRPGTSRGARSAFPQLRVVALAECSTHALFAARMGPCTTGEVTLAKDLVTALGPGMLCLADRGFTAYPLFESAAASGAELLWRARGNALLPVIERHPDGSYGSELVAADDRHRERPIPVRVIEYALDDPGLPGGEDARYRLVTTILDPARAPALELAALYPQRWEFESLLDELKTHQRGPRVVLRSKTPAGVHQEAWGYLLTHYAIRALMARAADDDGIDPDRISFTRALRAARRSVRAGLGSATRVLAVALTAAIVEVGRELLPARRLRTAARVVKRKMSSYGVKRPEHRCWPQPTLAPSDAIRVLAPP